MQIGGHTALLKAYRNHPVFNLVLDTGEVLYHRTFPEICNECFGVSLPDEASACDIQGWVLCLSMCDTKAFGPFLPEDTDIARCLDMASDFWETIHDLREKRLNLNAVQTVQGLLPCVHHVSGRRIARVSKAPRIQNGRLRLHSL